ncbi:MAG: YHYH protein [Phycisphaerales bacterium JB047]
MKWPTTTYFTCTASICLVSIVSTACSSAQSGANDNASLTGAADASAESIYQGLNPAYFISENLASPIVKEVRELIDGTKALCYVIRTYSEPHEHEMGPWAPTHITDGPEKGGIWIDNGGVFDVDGPFVRNIDQFYNDPNWKLYRDDGSIKVTDTKEAFMAAARPDVAAEYNNYVVEGRQEWIDRHVFEFVIPVKPIYQEQPTFIGRHQGDDEAGPRGARPERPPPSEDGGRPPRPEGADGERSPRPGPPDGEDGHGGGQINVLGIAFNGVNYEPPAPLDAILAAYTLAPFDDAGGHINPYNGYHYHAATGHTKEVAQPDGHAPLIGYIMDGYGLYAHENEDGSVPTDLDECGGHWDELRGYHYHAGAPGSNQIIKAFRGIPGTMTSEE